MVYIKFFFYLVLIPTFNAGADYYTIDISDYTNMGFVDDQEGDGKGGWTDEGRGNCASDIPVGKMVFEGVPFKVINPEENNGKSVIVLPNSSQIVQFDWNSTVSIPIKQKARNIYFLHACGFSGNSAANFKLIYSDGSSYVKEIRPGHEVFNWWYPRKLELCKPVINRSNVRNDYAVGLFEFNNPYPEKNIEALELESAAKYLDSMVMEIVVAITVSDEPGRLFHPIKKDLDKDIQWTPKSANKALESISHKRQELANKYGKYKKGDKINIEIELILALLDYFPKQIAEDLDGITIGSFNKFWPYHELGDKEKPELILARQPFNEEGLKDFAFTRACKNIKFLEKKLEELILRCENKKLILQDPIDIPELDASTASVSKGNFVINDKSVLLPGFYLNYHSYEAKEIFHKMGMVGGELERFAHCNVSDSNGVFRRQALDAYLIKYLDGFDKSKYAFAIDYGMQYLAEWAQKDPDILAKVPEYYGPYDIRSEKLKDLIKSYMDYIVPIVKDHPNVLVHEMTNQPFHYPYGDSVINDFRKWLKGKYFTIEKLNTLYGSSYLKFQELNVSAKLSEIEPLALRYDWMLFQRECTTEFYEWWSGIIKKHKKTALITSQPACGMFQALTADHRYLMTGIDREACLENACNVSGLDGYVMYSFGNGELAWNPTVILGELDFLSSVKPENPIFCLEYGFYDYNIESEIPSVYFYSSYMQSFLHGLDASAVWIWSREENADSTQRNTFASWADRSYALGEATWDVHRYKDMIFDFQAKPKELGYLITNGSRYLDPLRFNQARSDLWRNYLLFSQKKYGYVTERMLDMDRVGDYKMIMVYETAIIEDAAFEALFDWVKAGGILVVDQNSLVKNPYGKVHRWPFSKSAFERYDDNTVCYAYGKGTVYKMGIKHDSRLCNKDLAQIVNKHLSPEIWCQEKDSGVLPYGVESLSVPVENEDAYIMYCINMKNQSIELKFNSMYKIIKIENLTSFGQFTDVVLNLDAMEMTFVKIYFDKSAGKNITKKPLWLGQASQKTEEFKFTTADSNLKLEFYLGYHDMGSFEPVGAPDGVGVTIYMGQNEKIEKVFYKHIWQRKWQKYEVDISKYAGKSTNLCVVVDPGPEGNPSYDWLCLSDMKISHGDKALDIMPQVRLASLNTGEVSGLTNGARWSSDYIPEGWGDGNFSKSKGVQVCGEIPRKGIFVSPAWDGKVENVKGCFDISVPLE